MAQTHLPFAAIRALPNTYWEDEASVNGVWNGLLAAAWPGTKNYIIQPEGQSQNTNSQKRNDLLVREVVGNPSQGKFIIRLAFEGKSSRSSSGIDDAATQLLQYVSSVGPSDRMGERVWCIVARGTKWKAYQYTAWFYVPDKFTDAIFNTIQDGKWSPLKFNRRKPLNEQEPRISNPGLEMDVKEEPEVALHWLRWFEAKRGNRAVLGF